MAQPWLRDARLRRLLTVPSVAMLSAALGGTAGAWAPAALALDLATAPRRLTRTRLLTFAWAWSTLETLGVGASTALWATGRGGDIDSHYRLQRWWAAQLVDALRRTADLRITVTGLDHLRPGPLVMCARHASIADSLLPAWLLGRAGMRPRYVLKDDLLIDPCLDIVGSRLPNHFVDRTPDDSDAELTMLEQLAHGMTEDDAAVIFPEGAVVTARTRRRALDAIAARNPARAARIGHLDTLGPVRPAGTAALLRGAPDADLVFVMHTGFEQLQRIADARTHLPLERPVRVEISRVAREEIPDGDDFVDWFDARWSELDRATAAPS